MAPPNQFPHLLAFPTHGHPLGFPSTLPGQLPVGHFLQSREYNVLNNSHPVQGERQNNHMSQGENFNANSHNSSGWSSGFTNVLQDLSLDHSGVRQSSPHIESRTQVSHSNAFQQIYNMSRDILENIYFSLNSFFDIAQIRNLEDSYRNLETQIERLIPHVSHQTNEFNVQNMIHAMRNLQNKIEDKLINFYQSLSERDQIKVVFSLPHLQNRSFVQAVNRSVDHLGDLSVSQSVSRNISLVQNSPNNFSHIRTSSPKNKGYDIPNFKPQIDKDIQNQGEKEPIMNNLLGGNKSGNSNSLSSKI